MNRAVWLIVWILVPGALHAQEATPVASESPTPAPEGLPEPTPSSPSRVSDVPKPTTFAASFRLRLESSTPNEFADESRERARIRVRLGATHQAASAVQLGGRISTGDPANPTSSQSTLGDGFGKDSLAVDRAWIRVTPDPRVELHAGKVPIPVLESNLLWDKDVGPEGFSQRLHSGGKALRVFLNAGEFALAEESDDVQPAVLIGQVGLSHESAFSIEVAAAWYDYRDVRGVAFIGSPGTNEVDPELRLVNDYRIASGYASAAVRGRVRVSLVVEASTNTAVIRDGRGLQAELRAGWGPATLLLGYQRLEREATLDTLSESSWHPQRTNYDGIRVGLRCELPSGGGLAVNYRRMDALTGPTDHVDAVTADVNWEL